MTIPELFVTPKRVSIVRMRLAALLLVATACGRIDFGVVADAGAGVDADALDGADADARTYSCAGYLICDDFEAGIGPEWLVDPGVTIDATVAHRGKQSARMRTSACRRRRHR